MRSPCTVYYVGGGLGSVVLVLVSVMVFVRTGDAFLVPVVVVMA